MGSPSKLHDRPVPTVLKIVAERGEDANRLASRSLVVMAITSLPFPNYL